MLYEKRNINDIIIKLLVYELNIHMQSNENIEYSFQW